MQRWGRDPWRGCLTLVDDMIEALNSTGPEAAHAMDSDYSAPADPPDVALQSFDEDPVAA